MIHVFNLIQFHQTAKKGLAFLGKLAQIGLECSRLADETRFKEIDLSFSILLQPNEGNKNCISA